jgi:hypothetical protein
MPSTDRKGTLSPAGESLSLNSRGRCRSLTWSCRLSVTDTLPHGQIRGYSGNRKELRELKLKCSVCPSKDFEMFVVVRESDWREFLDGADPDRYTQMQRYHVGSRSTYRAP